MEQSTATNREFGLAVDVARNQESDQMSPACISPAQPVDLGDVLDTAIELFEDVGAEPLRALRQAVDDLRNRLAAERLHVAVLGQFKRGKSTVLNALLGERLLPTAVVPVTAIPTYVQAGLAPRVVITFRGDRQPAEEFSAARSDELAPCIHRFVTEEDNPDNRLEVARVEVFLPSDVLREGIVLIDTPGIGSTLRHNTEATLGFLPQCDVALFVVSVDPPLTQAEADFLATVVEHVPHLAFVLNKIDQIEIHERPRALAYLRGVLEKQACLPPGARIVSVSARQALEAKQTGNPDLLALSGFAALEHYLTKEVALEKSHLLRIAVGRKAEAVLAEGQMALDLILRSLQLPLAELEARVAAFDRATEGFERQRWISRDVLAGDHARALEVLESHAEGLRQEAARHLIGIMDDALVGGSDGRIAQAALAEAIPPFFDQALRRLSTDLSQHLDAAFQRHEESAEVLAESVRAKAAELFEIPCRPVARAIDLRSGREPYWVTQDVRGLHDPISEGVITRLLWPFQRSQRVRRTLLARIDTLVRRNVENVRWALRQNIDDSFRRLGSALDAQLADLIGALQGAIRAAQAKRREDAPAVAAEVQRLSAISQKLAAVGVLIGSTGTEPAAMRPLGQPTAAAAAASRS